MRGIKLWLNYTILWGVPLVLAILISHAVTFALPYGAGTYGTCEYNTCSISLSASGTINLDVIPTTAGVYTTLNDNVLVQTYSSTGYTLSMLDSDTNTDLVNGGNTVAASSGTQASPISLALNTWGYRVDGLSGFGVGPTTSQNSVLSSSYTFAGVPASNQSTHVLKATSAPADPAETTVVWFGVRIDASKPSGTYSDLVTYTAVVN